jgi:mevalonate kinase
MQQFRSNGKLLLTAEYLVLDGAKALALPTKLGQSLSIEETNSKSIIWRSYDENNNLWFEDSFEIKNKVVSLLTKNDNPISKRLLQIFKAALDLNPNFINPDKGYSISTQQDFNRHWGLGTSSTLINNIAQWAKIDAYILLEKTFGGSGYDIACAQHKSALIYQRTETSKPLVSEVTFNPIFKDRLYFLYLNKKQNSRDGIAEYRNHQINSPNPFSAINTITQEMLECNSLDVFKKLMTTHEAIISDIIKQKAVKDLFFSDFNGAIKSLGAWGGDFVLVASKTNPESYFTSKGLTTIIPYSKLI